MRNIKKKWILFLTIPLLVIEVTKIEAQNQMFLLRHLPNIRPRPDELTENTKGATYKPVFGIGDRDADKLHGIMRFGELTIEPGGSSTFVSYPDEEQMYYILEGAGLLHYDNRLVPVKQDDFMYLPVGITHGMVNSSEHPVRVLVMGYKIPAGVEVQTTTDLLLANTGDVELQVLGWHGPTTQFKLLMGTIRSTRDKLAAAWQMNSMFIMDFAPFGTNIPHRHPKEEEIYYVMRGSGTMVTGLDQFGNEIRTPAVQGDAFYFAANTQVGFYADIREGEEHTLIFAVRSADPGKIEP
jgi:mannose-6-phosphate isomerase-like protein (cupin superfamily)